MIKIRDDFFIQNKESNTPSWQFTVRRITPKTSTFTLEPYGKIRFPYSMDALVHSPIKDISINDYIKDKDFEVVHVQSGKVVTKPINNKVYKNAKLAEQNINRAGRGILYFYCDTNVIPYNPKEDYIITGIAEIFKDTGITIKTD